MRVSASFSFSRCSIKNSIWSSVEKFSIVWVDDFDCGEEPSESEKSTEKNEKLNFDEDFYLNQKHYNNTLVVGQLDPHLIGSKQNPDFSSSDYSQKVYSPPELI